MLLRITLSLTGKLRKPLFGDDLESTAQELLSSSIELNDPLIALLPNKKPFLVVLSMQEDLPDISALIGRTFELRGMKFTVRDASGMIYDPNFIMEEASLGKCASIKLVTPYWMENGLIPPVREILGSSLDVWKRYTGMELRMGRAKVLEQDLHIIGGKWGRGLLGRLVLMGEDAVRAAYIAGIVGVGEKRSKGFGYVEFLGDENCEKYLQ